MEVNGPETTLCSRAARRFCCKSFQMMRFALETTEILPNFSRHLVLLDKAVAVEVETAGSR